MIEPCQLADELEAIDARLRATPTQSECRDAVNDLLTYMNKAAPAILSALRARPVISDAMAEAGMSAINPLRWQNETDYLTQVRAVITAALGGHPMSEPTITQADRDAADAIFIAALRQTERNDEWLLAILAANRENAFDDGVRSTFAQRARDLEDAREAGKLAGRIEMQTRAVNHCKAGAANARIDVIIERYGDEATQHAADLLNAEAEELSRIDPATIAKEAL